MENIDEFGETKVNIDYNLLETLRDELQYVQKNSSSAEIIRKLKFKIKMIESRIRKNNKMLLNNNGTFKFYT